MCLEDNSHSPSRTIITNQNPSALSCSTDDPQRKVVDNPVARGFPLIHSFSF